MDYIFELLYKTHPWIWILVGVICIYILFVKVGQWLVQKIIFKWQAQNQRTDNVIPFKKPKYIATKKARIFSVPDAFKPSPLWLVVLAVFVAIFFKYFEIPSITGTRLEGRVTHVRDGDTIVVSGTPIRFTKLDCAELGTVAGERAKRRMKTLVGRQRVSCRLTGRRSYDRMIGECKLSNGESISEIMISEGYCKRWR